MGAPKKRPPGLVERNLPRPRGLHGSWLAPAWEHAQQEIRALDPSFPKDSDAENRGNPLLVDVKTLTAVRYGFPVEVLERHRQLFARIQGLAHRRLSIAFKRAEGQERKQELWDAMKRELRGLGLPDLDRAVAGISDPVEKARALAETIFPADLRVLIAMTYGLDPAEVDRYRSGYRIQVGDRAVARRLAIAGLKSGKVQEHDLSDRMKDFLARWRPASLEAELPPPPPALPPAPQDRQEGPGSTGRPGPAEQADERPQATNPLPVARPVHP